MSPSAARDPRCTRLGPKTGRCARAGSPLTLFQSSIWKARVFVTQSVTGSRSGSLGATTASTAPESGPFTEASCACMWALPLARLPTPTSALMPFAESRWSIAT